MPKFGVLADINDAGELILKPQRPQNREFSGRRARHRGHGKVLGVSAGEIKTKFPPPQRPQNLTPSAYLALQFAQATMPGIKLEYGDPPVLVPSDGDGWLALAE